MMCDSDVAEAFGRLPATQPTGITNMPAKRSSRAAKAYGLAHSVGRSSPLFSIMRRAMHVMDGTTE